MSKEKTPIESKAKDEAEAIYNKHYCSILEYGEAQQQEIEQLKEENKNIKYLHTLALNLNADLNLEKSKLKEEIRILKQDKKKN